MKDQRLYLGHIREAIADIRTYAAAGEQAFRTDRMRQDAIIRKLEVIGEAVDLIVSIERTPRGRRVRDVIQVERFVHGQYEIESDQLTEEQETRHVA